MKKTIFFLVVIFHLNALFCKPSSITHNQSGHNSDINYFRRADYSKDFKIATLAPNTSLEDILIKSGFVVEIFHDNHLSFHDIENDKIGLVAKLSEDGILEFSVQTKIIMGDDEIDKYKAKGKRKGKDLFNFMMQHFSGKIKAIKGKWIPTFPGNLNTFNNHLQKKSWHWPFIKQYSLEEAVLKTWTGNMMLSNGFKYFKFTNLEGEPGQFTRVDLIFYKNPEAVYGVAIHPETKLDIAA